MVAAARIVVVVYAISENALARSRTRTAVDTRHRSRPSDFGICLCCPPASYVTLGRMGSKDKGKKEVKKAPKPKPKPEPGRKREGFTPAQPK